MILNDMTVAGQPPAKLVKALATIASVLHPAFAAMPNLKPGISKRSCVLCSLTMRDFLWRIGFKDARVVTVYLVLRATDADGNEIHSLGCGDHAGPVPLMPGVKVLPDTWENWSGHMVVEVPSAGFIIDATLYNAARPAWPALPGMLAVATSRGSMQSYGLDHLAGIGAQMGDNCMDIWWLLQPNEGWRSGGDAKRDRRDTVVKALTRAFGKWRD